MVLAPTHITLLCSTNSLKTLKQRNSNNSIKNIQLEKLDTVVDTEYTGVFKLTSQTDQSEVIPVISDGPVCLFIFTNRKLSNYSESGLSFRSYVSFWSTIDVDDSSTPLLSQLLVAVFFGEGQ